MNEKLLILPYRHTHTAVILYMHAYSCAAGHSGAWICFKHTVQLYSNGHVCLKKTRNRNKTKKHAYIQQTFIYFAGLLYTHINWTLILSPGLMSRRQNS